MERVALVTGGNQGIGFEICRGLGRAGLVVVLTGRDESANKSATQRLRSEGHNVVFHRLDVSDSGSVEALRQYVDSTFGRLDVLVNNAAVYPDEGMSVLDISLDLFLTTLNINTIGPWLMCKAFIPMMIRDGYGRVVNVSSGAGNINTMGGETGAYRMSKAALNALTRIIANELKVYPNIKVNAMGPGWVRTEMGGPTAPRTPEEGADTAIWLATLPDDGPTDGYFYDRRQLDW